MAAVITGFISVINLILSKEQKVSEFRQNWIDDLRNDISLYSSNVQLVSGKFDVEFPNREKELDPEAVKKFYANCNKEYIESVSSYQRVILRLNPIEHRKLIKLLEKSDNIFHDQKNINFVEIAQIQEEIIAESQIVLKNEWRRVKKGETPFRVTKWVSIILLLSALSVASFMYYQSKIIAATVSKVEIESNQSNKKLQPTASSGG